MRRVDDRVASEVAPGGSAERSLLGYDLRPLSEVDRQARITGLSDEERQVLLEFGTEPQFCGRLLHQEAASLYA